MRGDLSRAAQNGVELARLAHEHDLPFRREAAAWHFGQCLLVMSIFCPGFSIASIENGYCRVYASRWWDLRVEHPD